MMSRLNSVLVSIIVPVYNVEKYLDRCLKSIISQTFINFELICVNDGSTDQSGDILDKYAKKDSRIVVIHKENGGLSSARNAAFPFVNGKFVCFVDSDDWLEHEALEEYVSNMTEDVDIVISGAQIDNEGAIGAGETERLSALINLYSEQRNGKFRIDDKLIEQITVVAWGKLFRYDILKHYGLKFLEGRQWEDNPFTAEYLIHAKNCYFINKNLYHYVQRANSLIYRKRSQEDLNDLLYIFDHFYKRLARFGLLKRHKKIISNRYVHWLTLASQMASSDQRERLKELATELSQNYNPEYFTNSIIVHVQNREYYLVPAFIDEKTMCFANQKGQMVANYAEEDHTVMKIALWGFGRYGRRMYESLTRFCPKDVVIVRVYDIDYEALNKKSGNASLTIYNPVELLQDYNNGLFEKVLVCMYYDDVNTEPKQFLKNHFIPEFHLGGRDDFYSASFFEQGKRPFDIVQEGYGFYVLKNIYGAVPNYSFGELLYLFDQEGRVIKDYWNHVDLNSEDSFIYDYPFIFKNSKAGKIFCKGQYCFLTKKYSGNNYWHFTYDNIDILWLLEQSGFQGKYVIPEGDFCREILRLLDITPDRIVIASAFEHNKIYVFEEVFCVSNVNGRQWEDGASLLVQAAEYIKKKLPVDPSLPKRIYVKRISRRKLLEADKLLAEYGFTTMIPENYTVQEQMTMFFNADIVFCVHGANSTNSLYMRERTVFIEAFSNYWIQRFNVYTAAAGKIHYMPITPMEMTTKDVDRISYDFKIPEVILRMSIENALLIYQAEHQNCCLENQVKGWGRFEKDG